MRYLIFGFLCMTWGLNGCTLLNVEDGAVRPSTNVAPDAVHVEPNAVVVQPELHVDPGAVAPELHVDPGAVVVQPELHVDPGAVAPVLNVKEGAVSVAPEIHIDPEAFTVDINVPTEPIGRGIQVLGDGLAQAALMVGEDLAEKADHRAAQYQIPLWTLVGAVVFFGLVITYFQWRRVRAYERDKASEIRAQNRTGKPVNGD